MSDWKNDKRRNGTMGGVPNKFEPTGAFGPIENRKEYEDRLRELPFDQRQIAEESARLADLCHYFAQEHMDIPPELLERVAGLSQLTIPDRVRALNEINRALMEYLDATGKDPRNRQ